MQADGDAHAAIQDSTKHVNAGIVQATTKKRKINQHKKTKKQKNKKN